MKKSLFFLISFFIGQAARADDQPITMASLVKEADLVLAGTVAGKESVWSDDYSTVYTYVTLNDMEVLKGAYGEIRFVLRVDGGKAEDSDKAKDFKINGIPEFRTGEKVLAFIKGNTQMMCPLVGWHEGLFRLRKDPVTGIEKVYSSLEDREVAGIENGEVRYGPDLAAMTLVGSRDLPFTSVDFKRWVRIESGSLIQNVSLLGREISADIRLHNKGRIRTAWSKDYKVPLK
jgi:hypothetical protein